MNPLQYRQVDVFASAPLSGNGLSVVITDEPLAAGFMQALTCELRQFETIFLTPTANAATFAARVFTMEEELPFAGHPAIGAAAVLHERAGGAEQSWRLQLPAGEVQLTSTAASGGFHVTMHQGEPVFGEDVPASECKEWLAAFGLGEEHCDRRMPLSVASTGLPYLVLPVTSEGLARARIQIPDLEARLAGIGAKFAYLLDLDTCEGRTWDNLGMVEDIATGSAAGPVAALLVKHGLARANEAIAIRQGRFVGRPSEMRLEVLGGADSISDILLSGAVAMVATGTFDDGVIGA
jgi:trans-2,3-dihydro-3-hydroxyanthranilate isomerase